MASYHWGLQGRAFYDFISVYTIIPNLNSFVARGNKIQIPMLRNLPQEIKINFHLRL